MIQYIVYELKINYFEKGCEYQNHKEKWDGSYI